MAGRGFSLAFFIIPSIKFHTDVFILLPLKGLADSFLLLFLQYLRTLSQRSRGLFMSFTLSCFLARQLHAFPPSLSSTNYFPSECMDGASFY
jgi:hypothetical protein